MVAKKIQSSQRVFSCLPTITLSGCHRGTTPFWGRGPGLSVETSGRHSHTGKRDRGREQPPSSGRNYGNRVLQTREARLSSGNQLLASTLDPFTLVFAADIIALRCVGDRLNRAIDYNDWAPHRRRTRIKGTHGCFCQSCRHTIRAPKGPRKNNASGTRFKKDVFYLWRRWWWRPEQGWELVWRERA